MKTNYKTFIKKLTRRLGWNSNQQTMGLFVAVFTVFALFGFYTLSRSFAATGNDLVVTAVTLSPTSPAAGSPVTFSATIKNQGTTAVPAGTIIGVSFTVDGQKISWNETNTAGLAVGASVTLAANAGTSAATWTATTGPHNVVATADDTNAISDETDEGNNALTKPFTIGSTGSLYQSPVTANAIINSTVTVAVRLTPNTTVDGVSATLTYDQTKLQFLSIDATGSPFDIALGTQTGGSGTVTLSRGNLSGGVSTDALIANVSFKALAGSGTTVIQTAGNATKNGGYTNPAIGSSTITFITPDTTPPSATITSPTTASNSFLTQAVTSTVTDAVGVVKAELYVDGLLKATDTSSPYTFSLNTTLLANGTHTLTVKGYDAAGNIGTSAGVVINVRNWAEDINQDGQVDLLDFSLLASKFGQTGSTLGRADINQDSAVNLLDFSLLAAKFGK